MMYNKENKIQRSLCFGLNLLAFNLISFSGSILFLSSLNDILQVPHRNRHLITYLSYRKLPENRTNYKLWRDKKLINTGNLCQRNQTATIAKVSPHLLDPILGSPTRPQKQNLSSSFLQIWLGFPSLTWQSTMLCHIMITWHWPLTCSAPGSSSQSASVSAGNHRSLSCFFSLSRSLSTSLTSWDNVRLSSEARNTNVISDLRNILQWLRRWEIWKVISQEIGW